MKKMIFHVHTKYSFDSLSTPEDLVKYAEKNEIDYLVISDHDDIRGSLEAREYAKKNNMKINIPVSVEFHTDVGDIIVLNVPENFEKIDNHKELCRRVKEEGGVVILPHPFHGHKLDKVDFAGIDYIEVFNSRSTQEENRRSLELAREKSKKFIFGADAHFVRDILKVICGYTGEDPFSGEVTPVKKRNTGMGSIMVSQLIRAKKTKDIKMVLDVFYYVGQRWARRIFGIKEEKDNG